MIKSKIIPVLLLVAVLAGNHYLPSYANLTPNILPNKLHKLIRTISVCAQNCEFTSIQAAINDSGTQTGDTLALESQTYTETITINKSITLLGTGYLSTTIQAAGQQAIASNRVIQVTDGITVVIDGITVRHGNTGGDGGGILNHGNLSLINSCVSKNNAANGGGVANIPLTGLARLRISNTTIDANEATDFGGGIYNYAPASSTLAETTVLTSTIVANLIEQDLSSGGGVANIANQGSSILIVDTSTFSTNSTAYNGGGIYIQSTMSGTITTTLTHTTFFGNAAEEGSNIFAGGGHTIIKNSILAYGQDSDDCYSGSGASVIDQGYNFIEDGSCGFTASGDPHLGSLANNGGDTKTHALLGSSPALDIIPHIDCAETQDQRGIPRPFGPGCDSGSFESNATELEFLQTVSDTNLKPGGTVTFTLSINLIGPGFTGGIIVAEPPPELTIDESIVLSPTNSGEIGIPPILAHSIEISANQILTLTMYARVAEGLEAGTELTSKASFTSNEVPTPHEDSVTLDVKNVPPVAVDDQGVGFTTRPDVSIFYTDNILANDYDLNGDTVLIHGINDEGLLGKLENCVPDTGVCAYNPNGKFDDMIPGQTETDTFTYLIWDGSSGVGGEDAKATVTITIRKDIFQIFLPLSPK